jgi:predicted Zn-dependent protease
MSAKFSLYEDFSHGLVPRFNSLGELAPKKLTLIQAGELKNSLVSARSAKEYSVQSNGATDHEGLRSPVMEHGDLHEDQILARLGTGLYLSNLHYLNWSDQSGGRITGMTRYACFWVEDGKIVSPIENLRWDDSLFTLLGSELEAVTSHRALEADVGTYERRNISAVQVPGILLSKMSFTL